MQPQPPASPEPAPHPYAGPPPVPAAPGLVPALGAPVQVPAGVRALALTAGLAVLALASVWAGSELATRRVDRLHALPYVIPLGVVLAVVLYAWLGHVRKPRSDGRVLEGTGVFGRQGIDLAALTAVAAVPARGKVSLTLRTPAGRLVVDVGALRTAGVSDLVGRAVWAAQEEGRLVVPATVAQVWGMPVRPGAPAKGRAGAAGPTLAVITVLLVALIAGAVAGSQ